MQPKRRQTRHKTVKQLTNCVTTSIRAASVCPVQSADCCSDPCDETKEKRWTLVINQVNASNRFIHLLIRWRTKLNKRHLIDEPSFVNPSTLSIKYPGRNQLDTHADTCTHSQKRENVTASNKKNSKTTKKHPPFWWFQHNHDHVA